MRRPCRIVLLLLALCGPGSVWAQNYTAFEQITVAASSIGFTAALIDGSASQPPAVSAICRLETAQIRFRTDGTAPTSGVGTLLEVGDVVTISGTTSISNFRGIRTGGSSGLLNCSYSNP